MHQYFSAISNGLSVNVQKTAAYNQQGNADKHHRTSQRSENSLSDRKILHRFCKKEQIRTPFWEEELTCWKTLQDQKQHAPYLWKVHLGHWSEIHSFWPQDNLKWKKNAILYGLHYFSLLYWRAAIELEKGDHGVAF